MPVRVLPGEQATATFVWDFSATSASGAPVTLSAPLNIEATVDSPPAGVGGSNGVFNECVETDNTGGVLFLGCSEIG